MALLKKNRGIDRGAELRQRNDAVQRSGRLYRHLRNRHPDGGDQFAAESLHAIRRALRRPRHLQGANST